MNNIGKTTLILLIALVTLFFCLDSALASSTPSITTGPADFISARNVYLNTSVNPNGNYTQVWFQIDTNNPPLNSRGHQGAGSGTSFVNIKAGIINLRLDTTYYYRAVAQNSHGTVYGDIRSFSTISGSGLNSSNPNSAFYNGDTSFGEVPLVATNGPASVLVSSAV